MFKRFIYEYIKKSTEDNDTIKNYFNNSDDYLTNILYSKTKSDEINKLISPFAYKGRVLYKPAFIIFKSKIVEEGMDTKRFFNKIDAAHYSEMIQISNKLAVEIGKVINKSLKPIDILIEKTPIKPHREIYELAGFEIYNLRKAEYEKYPTVLNSLNKYLGEHIRVFIFCAPQFYKALKGLSTKEFNKILGRVIP